jgi:hypothetical protein
VTYLDCFRRVASNSMANSNPWASGVSTNHSKSPTISPRSPLLASVIPLPPQPCIAYSVFVPLSPASHSNGGHAFIEQARRHVLTLNCSSHLLQSILPSVQVDESSPALYLFLVTSRDRVEDSLQKLHALRFENLSGEQRVSLCLYVTDNLCLHRRAGEAWCPSKEL